MDTNVFGPRPAVLRASATALRTAPGTAPAEPASGPAYVGAPSRGLAVGLPSDRRPRSARRGPTAPIG